MNILESIFDEEYFPSKALKSMPFSLRLEETSFYEAIENAMGAEFIERHWDAMKGVQHFRDYANFREGFRLGISLMLELL